MTHTMLKQCGQSDSVQIAELKKIASKIRGKVIEMSHKARTPHLGSSLSCIDIIVAIYWGILDIDPEKPVEQDRDRFILSKGHAATALYAALAERGFFPTEILETYNTNGGRLAEHPGLQCVPGVEAATGSLGHGLSIGLGIALASKIQCKKYKTFVLLSDGECNEGSVWEAAMFAPAKNLNNICVIVDYNKWQATGRTNEIMALEPLKEKWTAFGWEAYEIDGHDITMLIDHLKKIPGHNGRPIALIAHTVKGKGVSFMEDDNNWHYRIPTVEEVEASKEELGLL